MLCFAATPLMFSRLGSSAFPLIVGWATFIFSLLSLAYEGRKGRNDLWPSVHVLWLVVT